MSICEWLVSPLPFKTFLSQNINDSPNGGIRGGGTMKHKSLDSAGEGNFEQEYDHVAD